MSKNKKEEPIEKDWDHKKLGKELDLFTFSDTVGKGLPLWTPKGAAIRRTLERFIVDEEIKRGYQHVYTPDIAKLDLYKKSGHYPYYKESMYAPIKIEGEEFMLRPMTCPHHFELYLDKPRSYRDLPIRYAELAKLYRFEKSGELMGLQRVRSFCLADAHIICTKDQVGEEINSVLDLIEYVTKILGLTKDTDYHFRLSLGDRSDDNKKYYKDNKAWDHAEEVLRNVLVKRKSKFTESLGEAAFYGPKADFLLTDALGREWQCGTVQIDFMLPERFGLTYTDMDGTKKRPVMIHRAPLGSMERFFAILLENNGGAFPTWLAPIQTIVIPVSDQFLPYAKTVAENLSSNDIRVIVSEDDDTLNKKVRKAELQKIPYILVVGNREVEQSTVSVRRRGNKNSEAMKNEDFVTQLTQEISNKS